MTPISLGHCEAAVMESLRKCWVESAGDLTGAVLAPARGTENVCLPSDSAMASTKVTTAAGPGTWAGFQHLFSPLADLQRVVTDPFGGERKTHEARVPTQSAAHSPSTRSGKADSPRGLYANLTPLQKGPLHNRQDPWTTWPACSGWLSPRLYDQTPVFCSPLPRAAAKPE